MEGPVGGKVTPAAHPRQLLPRGMSSLGVEGRGWIPQQNLDPWERVRGSVVIQISTWVPWLLVFVEGVVIAEQTGRSPIGGSGCRTLFCTTTCRYFDIQGGTWIRFDFGGGVSSRSSIQELVGQAMSAEAGAGPFRTSDGLTATVEVLGDDAARLVEVRDQTQVVFSSCFVQSGAPRPRFYPDDVPFLAVAASSVVWAPGSGTLAVWPIPDPEVSITSVEERLAAFADEPDFADLLESAEALADGSREQRVALLEQFNATVSPDLRERAAVLNEFFLSGGSDAAEDLVAAIISFHRDGGWETHDGTPTRLGAPRATFSLGTRSRTLTAVSVLGSTNVMLRDDRGAS